MTSKEYNDRNQVSLSLLLTCIQSRQDGGGDLGEGEWIFVPHPAASPLVAINLYAKTTARIWVSFSVLFIFFDSMLSQYEFDGNFLLFLSKN
jgi:hypothetical protein